MRYPAYSEYKESDVEWIGKVPKHWTKWKVTHGFSKIGSGTTPKSDTSIYYDGDVPWVTTSELREKPIYDTQIKVTKDALCDYSTLKLYKKGALIMAMYGATIGRLGIIEVDATVNQACCVFSEPEQFDPKYFYYWLWMRRPILISLSVGGGQPNLSQDDLKQIRVPIPGIDEQQKIAAFLDYKTKQINRLIEKKKALIENLDEKRIAIITQAVTKGIEKNVKMKPSNVDWLGDVPGHWETRRLKFLTNESLQYGANEAAVLDDRDLPRFIRITDLKDDGTLHDDTFRSLPDNLADPFLLDEGDILLARSGATVGKSFKYSKTWGKAAYAGYLIKFSVNKEIMDEEYAYLYFQSSVYWANINSTLIQATIQNFSAEKYANIELPLPDLDEQKKIVSYLSISLKRIDKMNSLVKGVIEKLEEYRGSLITDAVTGKIDVRNIEIGEVPL